MLRVGRHPELVAVRPDPGHDGLPLLSDAGEEVPNGRILPDPGDQ